MCKGYCVDATLETAVAEVLESYGLDVIPVPPGRKLPPAWTYADQSRRISLGSAVLADVRREMPVAEDERRLIYRMVDAACARLEEAERPPKPATCSGGSVAALVAYAAGGGGALGSFESFQRRFLSDAALLEPTAVPLVDRQDVKPVPMTPPRRQRRTPRGRSDRFVGSGRGRPDERRKADSGEPARAARCSGKCCGEGSRTDERTRTTGTAPGRGSPVDAGGIS